MPLAISADVGDSLSDGTELSPSQAMGGKGNWAELFSDMLANVAAFGPAISPGYRGTWKESGVNDTGEWARTAGAFTAPTTSDAYDVGHGGVGSVGAGFWTVGGTQKWTKPAYMKAIVGFQVTAVDINRLTGTNGGNWQYRIDGGTKINMAQTVAHDNAIFDFYVASAVASTVEFFGNDGSSDVAMFILGITPFYSDPRSATSGYFHSNLAVNGTLLHDQVASGTAGNRLAWFSAHKVDVTHGNSPIDLRPNAFLLTMYGRDVTLANTSTWNTDLTTWNTSTGALGTPLWMTCFELAQFPDESNSVSPGFTWSTQTSYRDRTKLTAGVLGVKLIDHYDRYQQMGFGVASGTTVTVTNSQNVALRAAGLVNPLDNGHLTAAGHVDMAQTIYWYVRDSLPTRFGVNVQPYTVGTSSIGGPAEFGGTGVGTQYPSPSGKAVSIVAGTPSIHATATISPSGKAVAVVAGTPAIHATETSTPTGKAVVVTAGTPTIHASNTITPTGKAIAVTAGTPSIHASNTITPTGKAIVITAGAPAIAPGSVSRTATGVVVAVTAGTVTVHASNTITPAGKAVTVVAGSPAIAPGAVTRTATGVAVVVTAGTVTARASNTINPTGKAVAVTAGAPTVAPGSVSRTVSGVVVAVTAGTASIHASHTLAATGKAVAVTAGTPAIAPGAVTLHPSGAVVAVTAGSPTLQVAGTIAPAGKAILVTAGTPTIVPGAATLHPSGKAIVVTAGTPAVQASHVLAPAGKAIVITAGSPAVQATAHITPTGKAVVVTAGAPTVAARTTIVPSGAVVSIVAGAPVVHATRTIVPTGRAISVVAGTPTVSISSSNRTITVAGFVVQVIVGAVTISGGGNMPAASATVAVHRGPSASVAVRRGPTATVAVGG